MVNRLIIFIFVITVCMAFMGCGKSATQNNFDGEMHRIDRLSIPGSKIDKLQIYLRDQRIVFDELNAVKLTTTSLPSSAPSLEVGTSKRIVFSLREEANGGIVRAGITYYIDIDATGSILGVKKEIANVGP